MPSKVELLKRAMQTRVRGPALNRTQGPAPGTESASVEQNVLASLEVMHQALGTPDPSQLPAPRPSSSFTRVRREPSGYYSEEPNRKAQIIQIISKALIAMGESGMSPQ